MLPTFPSRVAVAAALVASALPASATAASRRIDLLPTSVSVPAAAVAGQPLRVRVVAAAKGAAAPLTAAAIYLSADAKRSKDDVRVRLPGRLPALAKNRARTLSLAATVPTALVGKTVRVIVCVDDPGKVRERNERNDCRAAKTPVAIVATLDAAATPEARIAQDLATGKLTPAQALEYRVFALFGDPKLPRRYAGAAGPGDDDGAMRAAASSWATLPPAVRQAIGKYFVPPPITQALEQDPSALVKAKPTKRGAKGGARKATRSADADEEFPDDAEQPAKEVCVADYAKVRTWQSVSAAGGKVRLHWETKRPEYGAIAKGLVADVTRAYARYKLMLQSEPLSDANIGCYHGEDGALDIYLTNVQSKAGITVPSAQSNTYDAQCEGYPGFIAADPEYQSFPIQFTVAHELFHAFQMAYKQKAGCKDSEWLDEGSATWAAHEIYPDLNSEHLFDFTLMFPHDSVEHDYHSWVFFLWMERRFGDAAIRTAYHALPGADSTSAVDRGIGTFRKQFLDFAKAGWNQDPEASFAQWDHLDTVPRVTSGFPSGPVVPVHFFLAGQKQRTAYAEYSLTPLGRDYKRYQVTDDQLRELTFKNPLSGNPNMRVGAYVTLGSGAIRWEDWSGKETVRFCRDEPNEDVRDIILVYANADPVSRDTEGHWLHGTPEFSLKDSCGDDLPWHYEVLWGQLTSHIDGYRPGDANDGLCVLDGFDTHDQIDFTAAADGQGYRPDENIVQRTNALAPGLSGTFSIKAEQPTRVHALEGCQGWDDFGPKTECKATHNDVMGRFTISASLEAASKDAQTATLTWGIPPAIAGFFDADDSVCNVGDLDHSVGDDGTDIIESEVLMSTLKGRDAFTVTITGDKQWMGPADLGDKATLTYHFEAKLRLQRVAADGSPL